ncbi:MAG: Pyridoxal-dependent decarboxylase [Caulobacteraceae bacterium]|nr:Pyridoxal-dependent decarboxylase [Caulobacteraceae bacterium]
MTAPAPGDIDLLYRRAGALAQEGRREEAQAAYLAVIARAPTHFGALNDLGTLLYNSDFRAAARLTYAEAVRHHPDNPIGRINLANALLADDRTADARAHYEAALRVAPDHPEAHQGMANLLQALGDGDGAGRHLQRSVRGRGIDALPYRGDGVPCRVLLLISAAGGNVPTRFLLDPTLFAVFVLPVEAHADDMVLPPHDLVFNAVGDADLGGRALDAVEAVLRRTEAPVINRPERVRATGRAAVAERLAGLPGVRAPKVALVPRETLKQAARRFGYPFLLRSPGFHTGRHFRRIDGPADLAAAAAALPGRALLMIEFLDARDARGRWRKFRAMVVGGRVLPMHLALSDDWKVHYFTADMADRPEHRGEEAAFLADMPGVLGPKAMAGLAAIAGALDLDYAGIDFGLGPDGEVLLFEANATMVVNPPEPDPRWDYRRAPVDRILAAVRALLLAHAGVNGG